MGKKASDRRVSLNTSSIILFARVNVCKGAKIVRGFVFCGVFFFCLCVVRSGASCALHWSVFQNAASTWERCACCRKAWGNCCILTSPLCLGRGEGEPLHGCTLAALCCFGRETCWSSTAARTRALQKTLEICSYKWSEACYGGPLETTWVWALTMLPFCGKMIPLNSTTRPPEST